MLENSRGLIKALENWAKKVTSGYKDVNVRDLSTSFRDGLAFCAIIHHYRPDLINFESLSKENIFDNNSLAFSVAEKQLGVPALLDAEDMVTYAQPDRLSIITYLSQLRNCFENQNKVKKHDLKRIQKSSPGPPAKIPVVQPSLNISRRHEVCQVCKHRVFILERLIVDGKLYHTTCFRCHKCNTLLNPGAYVESDTPGLYECSVCPDETPESLDTFDETVEEVSEDEEAENIETPVSKTFHVPEKEFTSKQALSFAKSNLNTDSPASAKSNISLYPLKDSNIDLQTNSKDAGSLVKDRISAFEKNHVNEKSNLPSSNFATPEIKIHHSPVISRRNEVSSLSLSLSSKFSTPNLTASSKTVEKSDFEKEKLPEKDSFSTVPSPLEKSSLNERAEDVDNCESENNVPSANVSSQEAPTVDLKTPSSEYKSLSRENSIFSVKSGSESPKSPNKVPRDIFKSSLQPLKLSLSPSIKKETNSPFTYSPITSPESEKSLDIPQIKSSYSLTLSSPKFGRSLAAAKQPIDFKVSCSESSLSSRNKSEIHVNRRSSLESSHEPSCKESSDKSETYVNRRSSLESSHEPSCKESSDKSEIYVNRRSSLESSHEPSCKESSDKSEIHVNRRSSLESSRESGSKESFEKSNLNFKSLQRPHSSYEISSFDDTDRTKAGLKNYSSVYKSVYNASSLSDRKISKFSSDNLSSSPNSHATSKVVSEVNQSVEKDVQDSDSQSNSISNHDVVPEVEKLADNLVTNKDLKDHPVLSLSQDVKEIKEEEYPDDLNPFGDEEETIEKSEEYPSDLNPFGDEEEEIVSSSKNVTNDYDESKNPFASDDDEDAVREDTSISSFKTTESANKTSNLNDSISSNVSSPSGSLKGTFKKRQAPKPPNVRDIFPKDTSDSGINSSLNSTKLSPSIPKRTITASSPKVRKNKPAPPPPPSPSPSVQDPAARVKLTKETDNMKLKSSATEGTRSPKTYKKKKRPAPPVPVPFRRDMKKIPLKEIMREMKDIEEKQREYERQGREIELLIRDRDKDEEPSVEEEEFIMQLFELVNQKNALFRRQAELMYIKRSQRLEEQQYKIEKEIRQLMEKPDSEKTDEDRQKEQELTMELIDIVDQRNSIIDSIEMDRRRELEEDHSVQEQFEMKNGDLTITAELKQKSGKNKKNKKKDKKKQQEEESGKGTLKKKKHLFSKKS